MIKNILKHSFLIASLGILFTQCTNESETVKSEDPIEDKAIADEGSNIMNFDGQLFSVPSPIQTAKLIKSSGADYNSNMINSVDNINQYNITQCLLSQSLCCGCTDIASTDNSHFFVHFILLILLM